MHSLHELKVAVIGLGYVGLPLAVEFSKRRPVVGFDINRARISALREGRDTTLEINDEELAAATGMQFTCEMEDLKDCNVFIATVPTPIDHYKRPDFGPLVGASETIGRMLKKDDIVIYESTVYPGATEEECVPVLERLSGLKYNEDFFVGYSPERINPGDKSHRVTDIMKVDLGFDAGNRRARRLALSRRSSRRARTRPAAFKVAEAAKVIENTQRDVNIALINELSIIFNRMGIDTEAVLQAAGTKWNFLPFRPGPRRRPLHRRRPVLPDAQGPGDRLPPGGHPRGAPHQRQHGRLRRRAARQGPDPAPASASRVPGCSSWVSTFKENCPDLRNTKVVDIVTELREYGVEVDVYDPWVSKEEARHEYGIDPIEQPAKGVYDATILAVAHKRFAELGMRGDPLVRQDRAGSL